MLYSFIYSPRKGTPAAEWEQIPMEVKNARYDRLIALQNEIALNKNSRLVGKTLRVLCDGVSKNNPDLYAGRTEGNVIAFFEGTPEDTGNYVTVTVSRAEAFALYGEKTK
jgi:tRNA-2-methylthio-N6-dimethylallyladenosine synthase